MFILCSMYDFMECMILYMLEKILKQLIFRILCCNVQLSVYFSVFVLSHLVLYVTVTFGFFGFYTIM